MKSLVRSTLLAAGIVMIAGVHNASAQIDNALEFTTSFSFTAGNATLPAGSYTITPSDDDPQVLELTGAGTSVFFLTDSAQPKTTPSKDEVVFSRYGGQYVLKNIWTIGSDVGYVTVNALGERHISKHATLSTESRVAARKMASAK